MISKQHQDSVLWLNGHSGVISKKHYVKKKKDKAVKDGRQVMQILLNGVDVVPNITLEREGIHNNDEENVDSRAALYVVDEVNDFSYDDNNNTFDSVEDDHVDESSGERQEVEDIGGFQFNEESHAPNQQGESHDHNHRSYSSNGYVDNHTVYGQYTNERCGGGGVGGHKSSYDNDYGRYRRGGNSNFFQHDLKNLSGNFGDSQRERKYENNRPASFSSDFCRGLSSPTNYYERRSCFPNREKEQCIASDDEMEVNNTVYGQYTNERCGGGGVGGHKSSYDNDYGRYRRGGNSNFFQHDLKSLSGNFGDSQNASDYRRGLSSPTTNYYERRSCFPNREKDQCEDDEMEVLRPLPLSLHMQAMQAKKGNVNWSTAEIEYARKAYDIIYAQLPLDQKRFISKEILEHIRNDPHARQIFHPSHLESSGKFRHVIRKYVEKEK
jgi:hypothetical protein